MLEVTHNSGSQSCAERVPDAGGHHVGLTAPTPMGAAVSFDLGMCICRGLVVGQHASRQILREDGCDLRQKILSSAAGRKNASAIENSAK
jgi:hypothetical protein